MIEALGISASWKSASHDNLQDVRELIPEFYYLPEFLENKNSFDFGTKQDGKTVHHGAETKFSSLSSTCVSMDERLFSYVTVHKKSPESNSRKSQRQQLHGRSADAGVH